MGLPPLSGTGGQRPEAGGLSLLGDGGTHSTGLGRPEATAARVTCAVASGLWPLAYLRR